MPWVLDIVTTDPRMDEVRRLLDATPPHASALEGLRAPSRAPPAIPPPATAPAAVPVQALAANPLAQPVGLAAGLLAVAGIIHLVVLPQHLEQARGIGLYFCAIGAAQVVWALLYVLRPTRRLAWIGAMALAVQPIAVYALTRFLRQPFGTEAEPVDLIGLVTAALELAALAPFAQHLGRTRPTGVSVGRGVLTPLAVAVVAGLAFGVALYGVGLVAEDLVPWLDEPELPHSHKHSAMEAASFDAAGEAPTDASAPAAHGHAHA